MRLRSIWIILVWALLIGKCCVSPETSQDDAELPVSSLRVESFSFPYLCTNVPRQHSLMDVDQTLHQQDVTQTRVTNWQYAARQSWDKSMRIAHRHQADIQRCLLDVLWNFCGNWAYFGTFFYLIYSDN